MSEKKNVVFLFGAGCEGNGQIGLPSGPDFKKDIILAEGVKDLFGHINFTNNYKIEDGILIAWNSTSILYQTICEIGMDKFEFDDNQKEIVNEYLKYKISGSNEKDKTKSDAFTKLYKEVIYDQLKDSKSKSVEGSVKTLLDNASFYSYVDSLFNYLRKPETYKNEVNRVMKLYFAAFNSLHDSLTRSVINSPIVSLKKIKSSTDIENQNALLDNRISLYNDIINKQQLKRDQLVDNGLLDGVYYKQIKDIILDSDDLFDTKFITANYTNFANLIMKLEEDDERIAHIHGKLELFEDLYTKRVAKLSEFKSTDVVFPFIFVPSGVKPVVNSYQIKEFAKAERMIANADEFIILGYNVNSDDEHISNLLRERVNSNGKITYFLYEKNLKQEDIEANKKRIKDELFATDNQIVFISTDNFESYLKSLKSNYLKFLK